MFESLETPAVFLLRSTQALALAAPTILTGMLAAGTLRVVVGENRLQQWLGTGTTPSLLRAWLIAMLIPACGFGVLPVLNSLRRTGASASSLTVIALTGPLMMPWTFGYALDAVGPAMFLGLLAVSFVGSVLVGITVQRLAQRTYQADNDVLSVQPKRSVLLRVLIAAGQSMSSGVAICILVGAAGAGLLATAIPPNMIGEWLVERSGATAGILFAAPLFTYVNPELATMQAREIVASSRMPGLVVAFAFIGSALNAGVLLASLRVLGWKTTAASLLVLLSVAVICAVAVDRMMYDPELSPEDSHAFEDIGRPFHLFDHPDGPMTGFLHRWRKPVTSMTAPAAGCLLALCIASRVLSGRSFPGDPTASETLATSENLSIFAAGIAVIYVLLFVYTYYPPPSQIAADIRNELLESDAAEKRGQFAESSRRLERAKRRIVQLPTSAALRFDWLDDEERTCLSRLEFQIVRAAGTSEEQSKTAKELSFRHSLELVRKLNH